MLARDNLLAVIDGDRSGILGATVSLITFIYGGLHGRLVCLWGEEGGGGVQRLSPLILYFDIMHLFEMLTGVIGSNVPG